VLALRVGPIEASLYYCVYALLFVGVSAVWFSFVLPIAASLMRPLGLRSGAHLVGLLVVLGAGFGFGLAALLSSAPRSEITLGDVFTIGGLGAFYGLVSGVLHLRDLEQS